MTEDEAKTKWCPQARVVTRSGSGSPASFNRYPSTPPDVTPPNACCIASDCMMWRWINEKTKRGYCGLAGAPRA